MKPVDVKPSIYIDFNQENKEEGPKFTVGDHLRKFQIGLKKFCD